MFSDVVIFTSNKFHIYTITGNFNYDILIVSQNEFSNLTIEYIYFSGHGDVRVVIVKKYVDFSYK